MSRTVPRWASSRTSLAATRIAGWTVGFQGLGGLHGLRVQLQGLLVVGMGTGSLQIAQQADRPGLDVGPQFAQGGGLLRGRRGIGNPAGLQQGLGLGHLVAGIAGIEVDCLGRRDHGLVMLAQRR